jgi:hypothetical protein
MQKKIRTQNNIIDQVVIGLFCARTAKLALKIAAIITAAPKSILPDGT